jgi:hypothetical protein
MNPLGSCPFPTIDRDGNLKEGVVLGHPDICLSCQTKPCRDAVSSGHELIEIAPGVRIGTCKRGVDFAAVEVRNDTLVVNGILVRGVGKDRPRRLKRELEGHQIEPRQLRTWRDSQVKAFESREREIDERIRETLEMFHDVQTAASSIIRSAERLQASQLGRNDDEKFAALHPAAQTLVKASGLQPVAQNKNVSMSLRGTSHRLVPIFESFDLLPLTLIENAIKYSARDSRIEVAVNEPDHGVSVGVTSLSPWISPDERQLIFERRYRGAGARALRPEGYGLGLSIAEAVANAHESRVLFSTDEGDDEIGGVRFSTNRFFFNLR